MHDDKAVALERRHRVVVELAFRTRLLRDETQRRGASLAEGAFEARLLAQRLEPAAARRAE